MSGVYWAVFRNQFALFLSIIVLAVPDVALSASDEELLLGNTVAARQRPELDPVGARMGSFLLLPKITLGLQYDDNIFATDTFVESDIITLINPAVKLESDWNNHALGIYADLEDGRYSDFSNEDYQDYNIMADGRLDISGKSVLSGDLRYSKLHELRTSPDDRRGITPTEYIETAASVSYFHQFSRLSMRLYGGQVQLDYKNSTSLTGPIYNDDRDRTVTLASLQLGYDVNPGYQVFIRGSTNSRKYDQTFDQSGFARSSTGYELDAGVAIALTGVTYGEALVGYLSQDYDDPRLVDIDDPTFGGKVTWNLSGLTTLTGVAERVIDETTFGNASGILMNRFYVGVDHELLRNLLLYGKISTTKEDYQGIDRIDDVNGIDLSAKYMLNRNFYVSFIYDYQRRNSETTISGARNYKINTYTIKIESQL